MCGSESNRTGFRRKAEDQVCEIELCYNEIHSTGRGEFNGLMMNLIFAVDIEIHDRPGLFSFTEDLQYQTEFC